MAGLAANTTQRVVGGFIDVAPLLVATVVIGVFAGPLDISVTVTRLVAGLGLLLKDVAGASPGKRLVGVRVADRDGGPASRVRRIVRNVTLAGAPLFMGVPFLGGLGAVICVAEMALVLANRERLGDRLAGTTIVRRAVLPEISAA
jgi:uncharacterized RDD family membrane protein YckC